LEVVSQLQDSESECKKLQLSKEMDELLYREEIMWLQRSRVAWLREGDRNTKYFHRQATRRKKKNCINKLKRTDGSITSDALEMEELTHTFFQGLYTRDDDIDPSIITDTLQQLVDDDMNNILCADFTVKEINDALFQIGPLKAPGPDGFPARFLQRNWELLRYDVVRAVQRFFTDGVMPDEVNDTAIVLIPKKE
jgi:type III secretory pathway component EscR